MIIALLHDLHRSHKLTSIYVTHNLSFATRCDRILQLDKGDLTRWLGDGVSALSAGLGTSDNV
jgi:lipoprotein-releasing system ATP-binding protein